MNLDELMKRVLLLDRDINARTKNLADTVQRWKQVRTGWYRDKHGLLPQLVNAFSRSEVRAANALIDASAQLRGFCTNNDLSGNPAYEYHRSGYHVESELMYNLTCLKELAAKGSALELQTAIINCTTYFESMRAGAVSNAVS